MFDERRLMKNEMGSAARLFHAYTDHQGWGILSTVICLQTTQHKTKQHQPKASDKFCSLLVVQANIFCHLSGHITCVCMSVAA